jgi:hypothetical protein
LKVVDLKKARRQKRQVPESEEILLKNSAWVQAAWLARMARLEGVAIGGVEQEKLIEWMGKWRENNADERAVAEKYPLPDGFLAGNALHGSCVDSENFRRSLAAYEKRAGRVARASDIDAFRASAEPLIKEAERTGRLFSKRLLDLVAAQGGEHSVIFTPGRVLKITEPDTAGGAVTFTKEGEPRVFHVVLPEYVRQLARNMSLAGDDIRIEGVMIEANGAVRIVSSQAAVNGTVPSYREIGEAFRNNGFFPVEQEWMLGQEGHELWWNRETNVAIADAKPANLVKTDSGGIVAIDVKAFQPQGVALDWIKKHKI